MSILRTRSGVIFQRKKVPGPQECDNCGQVPGYYHDAGCNMELCPQCGEQLLSCDCNFVTAMYQVFEGISAFDQATKFASDKNIISIASHQHTGLYKRELMVTVFYWN